MPDFVMFTVVIPPDFDTVTPPFFFLESFTVFSAKVSVLVVLLEAAALTEESGDFVYVANNHVHSNIYHLFIDCTYLVKKTKSFEYRDIPSQRNDANHTYSKCDYCFKRINLQDDTVCYITEYGDRFHYKSDCPLMTAYITKIPKEKIDQYDLNLCSRCNRRETK